MMLFEITCGLILVQNNLPLTYSNPDNILCGHTFQVYPAYNQGWLLQILILPLDYQFVEHFTPISWRRTMLFLYIVLIFECCT